MQRLTFLGASGMVTGSKYLLETDGHKILVDCGLFQGGSELTRKNWDPLPFDERQVEAVLLTHAHIDHTGYLPRLVRQGFSGPVYCSAPTRALLQYLLPDAARLQEEEAFFANKKGYSSHKPAEPLFTSDDAANALKLLHDLPFDEDCGVVPGITFSLHRVGHIMGAGFIKVKTSGASILFSGDVGQTNIPILKDPEPILGADYVLLESTYGDRLHGNESPLEGLDRTVNEAIARRGVVLIPAFAIGRTQVILYFLRELQRGKKIPDDLPIYVDSPMAISATKIYEDFPSEHDLEMRQLENAEECPIEGPSVRLTRQVDESKALNRVKGPAIIISASGMLNGGRILHHLKLRLPDPSTTLLFVGYQAQGTLGREILDGARTARIHGQEIPVNAKIEQIPALSAHADENELYNWFSKIPEKPKAVFLVHGEDPARQAFSRKLEDGMKLNVKLPVLDSSEDLA